MSSLHSKIYTAKKLVLKKEEIDNKRNTFATLSDNFNLSKESLIDLHKDGLIVINDCVLSNIYIVNYHQKRKEFETQQWRGLVASGSGNNPKKIKGWDSYLTDKYCGLEETIYQELIQNGKIDVNILDFENTIDNEPSPIDCISFNLEVYLHLEKLEEFLNKNTDSFRRDELDLSDDKTRRFLGYQTQKEHFAIGIIKETNKGYSPNNLKIDYTQIWQKDSILQTNFLETVLGMERDGIVKIRDIIEQIPKKLAVITSDTFWKYPTIIQIRLLPSFWMYYNVVYKKYNQTQSSQIPQEREQKKDLIQNHKEPQKKDLQENTLFPTPENTNWDDITIKFKNKFNVTVVIKGKEYESTYEKMGFADRRIRKPEEKAKANGSWNFLYLLSTLEGVFPIDKLTGKDKGRNKKLKQSLSEVLTKVLFPNVKGDPFYDYNDREKIYKIKIKLIPEKDFIDDFRDNDIESKSDSEYKTEDYFNEKTKNKSDNKSEIKNSSNEDASD